MRALIILILPLILVGCSAKNQSTTRDIAISLIERSYPVDGRRLEYSQIDSVDAEFQGYSIARIYIDTNDSIKLDLFHLNYIKTKTEISDSLTLSPGSYKALLVDNKIFSNDIYADIRRIADMHYGELCGPDIPTIEQDSIDEALIKQADSIIASNEVVLRGN